MTSVVRKCRPAPASSSRVSLDAEFLGDANRRLGIVSVVFACAVLALLTLTVVSHWAFGGERPPHLPHFLVAQSCLLVVSVAMALATRIERLSPRAVLQLGLIYQVLGALLISACAFYGDMLLQPVTVQLSWLAVWILLFPLFVPAPPGASLPVAFLSASTAPLVFLIWASRNGQPLPPLPVLANTFLPYYLCAGLGVLPAYVVYRLGASATIARQEARRLGSYQLVERLGEGGMGEVWRARHSMLARSAAIKLIKPEMLVWSTPEEGSHSDAVLARFEREANSTAALSSPHTVSLYDYGVTPEGTFYLVMELLRGLDLETLVERFGPVPPARVVYLLRQACDSLAEAHAGGMVHRDIKPANIFMCKVGLRLDFVKVLDFGLVSPSRHATDLGVTDPDFVLGTPGFVAPEMALGEPVDSRADIYGLGCVAYWLLTGELVFERSRALDVILDHINTPPTPPSARIEGSVPAPLERLILDCLRKAPDERPDSAEELARRLDSLPLGRRWTQQDADLWWQACVPDLAAGDT